MMILQAVLVIILKAAQAADLSDVSGYLGDTVILPSGADKSWNLLKIEWSILSNNTKIATFRSRKANTDRFYRYKGRLNLNTSSGDLMIRDLKTQDAMVYSVDLYRNDAPVIVNKVKLIVKQRLQKPNISAVPTKPTEGGCWVVLRCSSPDEGVDFAWQVKPHNVTVFNTSNQALLLAFVSATQKNAEFTCTTSRNKETARGVITSKCDVVSDHKPPPTTHTGYTSTNPQHTLPQHRTRYVVFSMAGVLSGVLAVILIYYFREQIKAAWKNISDRVFPSICSSECEATTTVSGETHKI